MTPNVRMIGVALGGIGLGAAGAWGLSARLAPPAAAPIADPYIPAAPGTPNAIGRLAAERAGGPVTPHVTAGFAGLHRSVVAFSAHSAAGDPGASWPCVKATGAWAATHADTEIAEGSTPADSMVIAKCDGPGPPTVSGTVRLTMRPIAVKRGEPARQRCEATVSFTFTGAEGKERRPSARADAQGDGAAVCAQALDGLEAAFRARIAAAP